MVFKSQPDSVFSATLTELYPFIRSTRDKWPDVMSKFQYPLTGLWPYPVVNRYLNFFTLFRSKRKQLFTQYEQQGGEYHGTTTLVIDDPNIDVSALSEDSGFDSVDNDFA